MSPLALDAPHPKKMNGYVLYLIQLHFQVTCAAFSSGIGEKYHSGQSHFMCKLHPPNIIYLTEPKWMKEDF